MSFSQKRNWNGPAAAAERVSKTMSYVPGAGQHRAGDRPALAEGPEVRVERLRQAGVADEVVLVAGVDDVRDRVPEMTATPKFATGCVIVTR